MPEEEILGNISWMYICRTCTFKDKNTGGEMCMDAKISGEFLRSFLYFCHSSVCTAKMPLAYDNVSIISSHSLYLHKKNQAA